METHTPKREAVEKFVHHESGIAKDWLIQVVEDAQEPIIRLQAWRDDKAEGAPDKSLEVHSRQVRLSDQELDHASKEMIRRWLGSL